MRELFLAIANIFVGPLITAVLIKDLDLGYFISVLAGGAFYTILGVLAGPRLDK